jgi:uncharacterized protein with GYD domain
VELTEGGTMATYVLLSTLTQQGRATLHANPDRMLGVNEEVERFGCHVVAQYPLLGPYDFLTIIEAPDNETVGHLSVDLGSRGTVNILSLPALSTKAFRDRLTGTEQLAAAPVVAGLETEGASPTRSGKRTTRRS